jgi:hypothetical protein
VPAGAKALEVGEPIRVAEDGFAIDDAGAHRQGGDGGEDQREAVRPIVAVARQEPDALSLAPGNEAKPSCLIS